MDVDRGAVFVAAWASYAALILSAIVVACLDDGRVKPESNTECCTTSRQWAFVPLPRRWPLKKKRFAQSILLVVALVACICQVLVLMLQPSTETLAVLATYNFVNMGFVVSYWTGEAFLSVQALSVGAGCALMWIATVFETYYVEETTEKNEDEAALLLLFMWVLAACSVVDFTFYVVFVCCCFGSTEPSTLDDQLVPPAVGSPTQHGAPAEGSHDNTAYHMYTIGSDEEGDITTESEG